MNKLERDTLNQIDELNEGILSSIARMFMSRKVKSKYKKVYKIAKDDPELQSALADLEDYHGRLNKILKTLCKRNPDHPKC
tara:strand:- start:2522 stop:2764 length:243 start_codon:yes stop_codon:yes gene_type:complete